MADAISIHLSKDLLRKTRMESRSEGEGHGVTCKRSFEHGCGGKAAPISSNWKSKGRSQSCSNKKN